MSRKYVFADEAGDFTFNRAPNVSRYFIVCTLTMTDCDIGETLLRLRRDMAWKRYKLGDQFHATSDAQATRDMVFGLLGTQSFRIDATILEKAKAQPQTRSSEDRFYKTAWYYHFKHIAQYIAGTGDELLITTATLGTKKTRTAFTDSVKDVIDQTVVKAKCVTAFWPSQSDPCLQVTDYCTWAIQRKWERQDSRSYDLIRSNIKTEYNLWSQGQRLYY